MYKLKMHKELSCIAEGNGCFFAKKGSMVAYIGTFKFEKVLLDTNNTNLLGGVINHIGRKLTGENMELMKVIGQGSCYLADCAQHITTIDLNANDCLNVESENLLAFTDTCKYGVKFIGSGIISQKGLFTSKLTCNGENAQVAIKTDGNPIILNSPCIVDPDAIVCWTGADPNFKLDVNWKTILGQTSGESYMLDFKQPGYIVIVQPSERLSGLKLGIDDKRYTPTTQNNSFNSSVENINGVNSFVGNLLRRS